jgi:hypothetical protein
MAAGYVCGDEPQMPFVADGTAAVEGNRLHVTWTATNGCDLDSIPASDGYTYEEATDTLVDEFPSTWTRADDDVVVPTREPAPPSPRNPNCNDNRTQFNAPGTYTAPAGSLSLTVSVPGTPAEPWRGSRSKFSLTQAACADLRGTGAIYAGEVTQVDTDACEGARVAVDTLEEAVAAVSTAKGIDVVAQSSVTLGGHTGTRFDIRVHDAANACPDGQIPLVDGVTPFDQGLTFRLYLIDVDGKTLAVGLYGSPNWRPDVSAKVDDILASMQIGR